MDNLRGIGPIYPDPSLTPGAPVPKSSSQNVSFDQILKETQMLAYNSPTGEKNSLENIPTSFIPMENTTRQIVGYQSTFLGTFSKQTEASIIRTNNKIEVKSPLGNMKIEVDSSNPEMFYVQLPQGNFYGKLTEQNGDILIQSDDKKKSITIHQEANGDIKVTNKGIQEGIKLVFKS